MEAKSINLREVLYYIVKNGKCILALALALMILFSLGRFALSFFEYTDEARYQESLRSYEEKSAIFQKELETCRINLDRAQALYDAENKYQQEGVIFSLNSADVAKGKITLIVFPEKAEELDALTAQYLKAMDSDEVYLALAESLGTYMDDKDPLSLKDCFEFNRVLGSDTLEIDFIADSLAIAATIRDFVIEKMTKVKAEAAVLFDVSVKADALITEKDEDLALRQEVQKRIVTDAYNTLRNRTSELQVCNDTKPIAPKFGFGSLMLLCGKYALIGFAGGLFLGLLIFASIALLCRKVLSPSFFADIQLPIVAIVSDEQKKNRFFWLAQAIFGEKPNKDEEKTARIQIGAVVGDRKIAVVSDVVCEGCLNKARSLWENTGIVECADILQDADAMERMSKCEAVLFLAHEKESSIDCMNRMKQLVNACGKTVVGVIYIR